MSVEAAIKDLKEAFYAQDDVKCPELTKKALEAGADPLELLENHLLAWTKEICGRSAFQSDREAPGVEQVKAEDMIMLSELIMIAECLTASVSILRPELAKRAVKVKSPGRIVVGTVEGDIHDIGKSLVANMWAAAGYAVVDMGYDVPAQTFVNEARMAKADIIGISCSMAMARCVVGEVVDGLKKRNMRDNVKIITGGQASFGSDIETYGTDAFGVNLSEGLSGAKELMRILKEERQKK